MTDSGQGIEVRVPSFCLQRTEPVADGWVFVDITVTSLLSIHTLAVTSPLWSVFDSPLWSVSIIIVISTCSGGAGRFRERLPCMLLRAQLQYICQYVCLFLYIHIPTAVSDQGS